MFETRNSERNPKNNAKAVHTSKSSKKRVSSCPELYTPQDALADGDWPFFGARCSHPANYHEEWYDKSGDLLKRIHRVLVNGGGEDVDIPYDRTAQTDANSKLHFVLHSHSHGSNLSGYICLCNESSKAPRGNAGHTHDKGKENKTDERLWNSEPVRCLLDRVDH